MNSREPLIPQTYGPRPPARSQPTRRLAAIVIPPILLGAALIGVWYWASYVWLQGRRRILLAPPHRVVSEGFLDGKNFAEIMDGMWVSAKVAAIGLAIGVVVGLILAVIMSQAKAAERAVYPFMIMFQAIPILAMTPLISQLFGSGQGARVIVCVIFSFFPIAVNTLFGLQSAERGHHDLFTLNGAGRWTRLRLLMIPGALPAVFAGLRISASLAVIGGIVADFFFGRGEAGLGQLIAKYKNELDSPLQITAILVSCAFGVAVFLFFGWIQKKMVGKWYEGSSQQN